MQLSLFENETENNLEPILEQSPSQPILQEKKCNTCNINLPLDKFVKDRDICKPCRKIKDDNRRKASRKFLFNFYLSHPCVDCGETNPFVLQLDHLYDKKKNVSQMICNRTSIPTIKKEIEKCAVRCSNCHAKKTAKDQKWYKDHYDHDKEEIIKEVDET